MVPRRPHGAKGIPDFAAHDGIDCIEQAPDGSHSNIKRLPANVGIARTQFMRTGCDFALRFGNIIVAVYQRDFIFGRNTHIHAPKLRKEAGPLNGASDSIIPGRAFRMARTGVVLLVKRIEEEPGRLAGRGVDLVS